MKSMERKRSIITVIEIYDKKFFNTFQRGYTKMSYHPHPPPSHQKKNSTHAQDIPPPPTQSMPSFTPPTPIHS